MHLCFRRAFTSHLRLLGGTGGGSRNIKQKNIVKSTGIGLLQFFTVSPCTVRPGLSVSGDKNCGQGVKIEILLLFALCFIWLLIQTTIQA